MGFLRSFIAFTLLVIAVVLGFGGVSAQWLDRLARTPAPLQQIVGPLASDPEVIAALKSTLASEATRAIPEEVREVPFVGEQINALVTRAVDATLADAGVQRAWHESINRSRVGYVAALDTLREDGSRESPTIWFDLTPFAELGAAKLREVSPAVLRPYVDQVQFSRLRVSLGQPPAATSATAADAVGAARNWPYFYLGAALLSVIALAAGSRLGRWVSLALAGVFATVGLWFGRSVVGQVGFPTDGSLAGTIRSSVVDGGTDSFLAFTQPGLIVAYAAVAVGVIGALVAGLLSRART